MSAPTTLTPAELGALAALADSPLAAEARARHETARTAKRREIIAAMRRSEAIAKAEAERLGAAAATQRLEVDRLRVALVTAHAELHGLESAAGDAASAAERALLRANAALGPLGGAELDDAIRQLTFAARHARALIGYREGRDWRGVVTISEADPAIRDRAIALDLKILKLQALQFADVPPAEIAEFCREALAALEADRPATPFDTIRGAPVVVAAS